MAKIFRKFRESLNDMSLVSEGPIASRAVMEKYLYGPSSAKATLAIWKGNFLQRDTIYLPEKSKIIIGEALTKHFENYFGNDYEINMERYQKCGFSREYFELSSPKASGILIIEKKLHPFC